jgi:hypothetical protein
MRPLLIDQKVQEEIKKVIDHASKNVFSIAELQRIAVGELPCAGDRDGFVVLIPIGFRAVFNMSNQPAGLMRELSVSVNSGNRVPSPEAMELLLTEFGFIHPLTECIVRKIPNSAIFVAELVDPDAHAKSMAKRRIITVVPNAERKDSNDDTSNLN